MIAGFLIARSIGFIVLGVGLLVWAYVTAPRPVAPPVKSEEPAK